MLGIRMAERWYFERQDSVSGCRPLQHCQVQSAIDITCYCHSRLSDCAEFLPTQHTLLFVVTFVPSANMPSFACEQHDSYLRATVQRKHVNLLLLDRCKVCMAVVAWSRNFSRAHPESGVATTAVYPLSCRKLK